MPKGYHHLTRDRRCQISALLQRGDNHTDIAKTIGVHPSTISREVKRNSVKGAYVFDNAQRKSLRRRRKASKRPRKLTHETEGFLREKLNQQWSPQQISGWLKVFQIEKYVSHETIYNMVYRDKSKGGTLHENLRRHRKKYRKRGASKAGRGCIPNRVGIEKRPEIANTRERLGDWELDTIVGKKHVGAIVTMVERKTKLTKLWFVPRKTASNVAKGIIMSLRGLSDSVFTLTADNGGEFAMHEEVSKALKADFYFSTPYHAWERGLNEHTNGLLRQYFPKECRLENLSRKRIQEIEDLLNNRPRKVLNYLTPLEAFEQLRTQARENALRS